MYFGNLGEYHLHRLKCKFKGDGSEVSMMNRQGVVKEFLPGAESQSWNKFAQVALQACTISIWSSTTPTCRLWNQPPPLLAWRKQKDPVHGKYCKILPCYCKGVVIDHWSCNCNCKGHFDRWQERDESSSGKIVFPVSFSREIPQEVCTSANIVDVVGLPIS